MAGTLHRGDAAGHAITGTHPLQIPARDGRASHRKAHDSGSPIRRKTGAVEPDVDRPEDLPAVSVDEPSQEGPGGQGVVAVRNQAPPATQGPRTTQAPAGPRQARWRRAA